MTKIGKIKWFNDARGYGFVETEAGDIFLHARALHRSGLKEFDIEPGVAIEFTTIPRDHNGTPGEQVWIITNINGEDLT